MKSILLFLSLSVFAHIGFSQNEVRLTEKDNGKVLNFTTKDKGKLVSIEVSDNSGSTGYTWNVVENNVNVAEFVGKSFISSGTPKADQPPMVGTSSPLVFTFKLTGKPGASHIKLGLARAWEKGTAPEKSIDCKIMVKQVMKKKTK